MPPEPDSTFQLPAEELASYLGELAAAFETHPDEQTRQAALSLLQGMDALHRAAFERLFSYLETRQADHFLVEAARADRIIQLVLGLYDLLPPEIDFDLAEAAIDRVRPYIESHGGKIKLLAVENGLVTLEMGGACQGCAGSAFTIQRGIRRALEENLPHFVDLVVREPAVKSSSSIISLDQIYTPPSLLQGPNFQPAIPVEEVPPGTMVQVALDQDQVLVINQEGEIFATGALCPGSMLPLANGRLDGGTLVCGWHGERFDIWSGACLDPAGKRNPERLPVYPVAVQDSWIHVAANVPARPPVVDFGEK